MARCSHDYRSHDVSLSEEYVTWGEWCFEEGDVPVESWFGEPDLTGRIRATCDCGRTWKGDRYGKRVPKWVKRLLAVTVDPHRGATTEPEEAG